MDGYSFAVVNNSLNPRELLELSQDCLANSEVIPLSRNLEENEKRFYSDIGECVFRKKWNDKFLEIIRRCGFNAHEIIDVEYHNATLIEEESTFEHPFSWHTDGDSYDPLKTCTLILYLRKDPTVIGSNLFVRDTLSWRYKGNQDEIPINVISTTPLPGRAKAVVIGGDVEHHVEDMSGYGVREILVIHASLTKEFPSREEYYGMPESSSLSYKQFAMDWGRYRM